MSGIGGQTDATAAPGEGGLWTRITDSLTASQTKTVDTVPVSTFTGARYIITMWNTSNEKARLLDLSISKKNSSTLKDTIYAKIGDNISVVIAPSISGSNMIISMTNNELFTVGIEMSRLTLGTP